jgi:hypothetical protein
MLRDDATQGIDRPASRERYNQLDGLVGIVLSRGNSWA